MQRGSTVLAARIHRPACGKHQADRLRVVGLRGIGYFTAVVVRQRLSKVGASVEQGLEHRFVPEFAGEGQP